MIYIILINKDYQSIQQLNRVKMINNVNLNKCFHSGSFHKHKVSLSPFPASFT